MSAVAPQAIYLSPEPRWPNNSLPALLYRGAVSGGGSCATALEALFARHGWPPAWRDTVYDYFHYHTTAHECLGVAVGAADLKLGGDGGRILTVTAGDVLVLPAGVAHRRLTASADFLLVGAYPPGQSPDRMLGEAGERPAADHAIASLPIPATDPVQGAGGALMHLWNVQAQQ